MAKVFSKLINMQFTSFRSRSDDFRSNVIKEFINQGILNEFKTGKFSPYIYKEITLDDVKIGHQIMEQNQNSGKIVMKIIY